MSNTKDFYNSYYNYETKLLEIFYTSNKDNIINFVKSNQLEEKEHSITYTNKTINLIVLITSLSRSLIDHGVPSEYSLMTAENLMNIMLLSNDTEALFKFEYQVIDFFYDIYANSIDTKDYIVISILNYIYKHLAEPITIKDIAYHLNTSQSYISNKFNNQMKMSLKQYINIQKLERAKQILRDSDNSILNICIDLSYPSQSYFSKIFKKYTNLSPTQYRKLNRKFNKLM